MAGQLIGININADHTGGCGQIALGIHVIFCRAKFGAHRQHSIGAMDQRAHRIQTWAGGQGQRMAMHHAARIGRLHNRGRDMVGQLRDQIPTVSRAPPHQNDGRARLAQHLCGLLKLGSIRRAVQTGAWRGANRSQQVSRAGCGHDIGWHFDVHRATPAMFQQIKRLIQGRYKV